MTLKGWSWIGRVLLILVVCAELGSGVSMAALWWTIHEAGLPQEAYALAARWLVSICVLLVIASSLIAERYTQREEWDRARDWRFVQVWFAAVQFMGASVLGWTFW